MLLIFSVLEWPSIVSEKKNSFSRFDFWSLKKNLYIGSLGSIAYARASCPRPCSFWHGRSGTCRRTGTRWFAKNSTRSHWPVLEFFVSFSIYCIKKNFKTSRFWNLPDTLLASTGSIFFFGFSATTTTFLATGSLYKHFQSFNWNQRQNMMQD